MYGNPEYNNSATVYGGGYGMDYQQMPPQQYRYPQQVPSVQQGIAGVMGYYPPDTAAMFYNPYVYGAQQHMGQHPAAPMINQRQQQPIDYQLTPALYLLNQQAELLQRSQPLGQQQGSTKQGAPNAPTASSKVPRKSRGAYKRRANKSASSELPAPEQDTDSDRLSTSDLSGGNNSTTNSIQQFVDQPQRPERKRKNDSFPELKQRTKKQFWECTPTAAPTTIRLRQRKQSIFCSVALMAESSCSKLR